MLAYAEDKPLYLHLQKDFETISKLLKEKKEELE